MKIKYANLLLLLTLLFSCGGNNNSENSSTNLSSDAFSETSFEISEMESSSQEESSSEKVDFKVLEVFKAALDNQEKVKSGVMTYNSGYNSVVTNFEFGKDSYGDFVHTSETNGSYVTTTYYGYDKNKELYALEYGQDFVRASFEVLVGEEVYGPSINPYENEKMSGTYGIANKMYNLAIENANWDFTDLSTSEQYKFSVGKVIDGLQPILWMNTVSFVIEDEALKELKVTFEQYTEITADYEFNNVYYINDDAKVKKSSDVSIEQSVGERTLNNPYDIELYYFEDFSFKDSEGNVIEDSITMDAGVVKELQFDSFAPNSADTQVDQITITDSTGLVTGGYNSVTNVLFINCHEIGEYDIVVSSKRVIKNYKLSVEAPAPSSISILYYIQSGTGFYSSVLSNKSAEITTYVGSEIFVKGSFSPYTAEQNYTLEVVGQNIEKVNCEQTEIQTSSFTSVKQSVYKISSDEVGSYRFKVSSTKAPSVSKLVKFEVIEKPLVEDLLSKRYVTKHDTQIYLDVDFTPDETNYLEGTLEASNYNNSSDNGTYKYTYDPLTRKFNLIKLNGLGQEVATPVSFSLEFNGNYDLVYTFNSASTIMNVFSYAFMLSNIEWQGRDSNGGWSEFEFNEDGTGTFNYSRSDSNFAVVESYTCEITFTVENIDGVITITLSAASLALIEESGIVSSVGILTTDENFRNLSVTLSIHEVEQTLTLVIGG